MSINPPAFACTLQERIPIELEVLYQATRTHVSDQDKLIGVELLAEAYCDLLDICFVQIIEDLNRTHPSPELLEARRVLDDIQEKIRHYVRWTAGFIANDRIPPVIAHFYAMTYQQGLGRDQPFMGFNLSPALGAEIVRVVSALKDGSAQDFADGIELIIQVIDETMGPLAIEPKNLIKFNFVVNKTLDGIIALVKVLFKRMLRKLAPKLPPTMFPQIAAHLESFLIVEK